MKKKFLVFVDDIHDYTITSKEKEDKTIYKLFYSKGDQWTSEFKGSKRLTIIEGDLDMTIKFATHDEIKCYHEIIELKILIDFITTKHTNGKVKIIQEVNVI